MTHTDHRFMPCLMRLQRLGLVAPFTIGFWDDWWAKFREGDPSSITMSALFDSARGREEIAAAYQAIPLVRGVSFEGILYHEIGHAFQFHWKGRHAVAPKNACQAIFGRRNWFEDPYNDLTDYLDEHDDARLDKDEFISWYAWSDSEEDFADCFAQVALDNGRIDRFRYRPGVYRKLRFIRDAGRRVLARNPLLRECNRKGYDYLFGGHTRFPCPNNRKFKYGVPWFADSYICPCGAEVVCDGETITHEED